MAWLKPVILQLKNHFPSTEGAHVTTETFCKATQKKPLKTDGDRTLQLTIIDLMFEREKVMWTEDQVTASGLKFVFSS